MPTHDPRNGLTPAEKAGLLSGEGFWNTRGSAGAGVRPLVLTDGPHGVRRSVDSPDLGLGESAPATCFPSECATASSWNPELLAELGRAAGLEAAAQGVDVLLGPGLNLKRTPLGGRNFEYFSEDPLLSGLLGTAWVRGVQSQGVAACPKHFAANNQETDRMTVDVIVDQRTLRELYLRAFEMVVRQARPWTIMAAYNKLNGFHAAQDPWLLTQVLRNEWGFDGVVVSDWGAVTDLAAALAAGLDLEMPASNGIGPREVLAGLDAGLVSPGDVDAAVERLRVLGERTADKVSGPAGYAAHDRLARRAAVQSMVLLKNDGGVLPFSAQRRLVVIGELARTPRYQGSGSSRVNPVRLSTPWNALAARVPEARFTAGYVLEEGGGTDGDALAAEAVAAAADGDQVVVFLGLPDSAETEGADRVSLDLPENQLRLLSSLAAEREDLTVVLFNGSAVTTAWALQVPAVLEGWLGGQGCGEAVADILLGDVNPSGKLAETFPLSIEDTPAFGNFPGEDGEVRYGEGLLVGYRWYDTRQMPVAFPFGHGLSYTSFDYTGLEATAEGTGTGAAVRVCVTVTNTGGRAGAEVVQLYVGGPPNGVPRPAQELRGFSRVELDPGESTRVTFDLAAGGLDRFDPGTRSWVTDSGAYLLKVGSSSRDIRLSEMIEVEGSGPSPLPTASSPVNQWLADPRAARVLLESLTGSSGGNGDPAAAASLSAALSLMGSLPLDRLGRFPGAPLGAEQAARLARELAEGAAD
ncbi:glycoside hydrolase family 3 C-terminal domain-containing protein [Arthrobacter caoxuetaonis]|uniref:glycoside hydrolase family 3 C-terminal domain-containing protein n=1 Tax=Arthrobacter caoxuetaonis TaxID=2886935 RepID=UPI001D14171E|nr:glycoside hydrolase family 3 C-terminal domain-containing protein [Arthrobacter caoxuetaonis]MCC3283500.1 glycoside hydrolase family 3 C-terminal domain-containing protein [Arthrobacter caoxuetaonis]